MTIENTIRKIISNTVVGFSNDKLSNNVLFTDAGVDSLDIATILLEVQEKFDVELPEGQEDNFDTLEKLIEFVQSKLK